MIFRSKLLLPAVLAALAMPGVAQAANICGLTTVSGGTASITYDPFNPSQSQIVITNLVLSRINPASGEKTSTIDFYVTGQNANENGSQLVINSASGSGMGAGLNQNLFFNFGSPGPNLSNTSSPPPGVFYWAFSGNNAASDTFTVNLAMTLPANLNVTAGNTLPFDIVYSCHATGNGGPIDATGTFPNAIVVNVKILSALQASYAGQNLDFGEIGQVTTAQAQAAPGSYRTSPNNYIRVQSSGPYEVNLTSGNNYKLTFPGGQLTQADQTVQYALKFLGDSRSPSNTTAIDHICVRAGVGSAFEQHLFLQGTLLEGGSTKMVAPNYQDILTVVISPMVYNTPASDNCGAYSVP